MDPAETLALVIAATGLCYLAIGGLLDAVRWATRLRLGWLPSLQRTIAAAGIVLAVARTSPAAAALPPPAMRLDPGRAGSVAAEVAEPAPAEPAPAVAPETYRVQPGDSLWAIAARHLSSDEAPAVVDRYWRAIYDANRELIGNDPDLIFAGQALVLPDAG